MFLKENRLLPPATHSNLESLPMAVRLMIYVMSPWQRLTSTMKNHPCITCMMKEHICHAVNSLPVRAGAVGKFV